MSTRTSSDKDEKQRLSPKARKEMERLEELRIQEYIEDYYEGD